MNDRGTVSLAPEGLSMSRYLAALALANNDAMGALSYAEGRRNGGWQTTPTTFMLLKTAIGAVTSGDAAQMSAARGLFNEYLPLLRARTLIDRVPGWRRVPQDVSVLRYTADATAALIAEGGPIQPSKFSLERVTLGVRKVGGAVVVTKEAIEGSHGQSESLATELARAIGSATDRAMLSVDASTSIAAAGTIIPSAGTSLANIDSDLRLALSYFNSGDAALDRVVAVTSPAFALYLSLLRGTSGAPAFPNVNVRSGGNVVGVPLYVSNALAGVGSPGTSQISFVDPAQVLVADPQAIELSTSESATIQQDDASTQNSATPTATTVVSMFQANCIAIAGLRWCNWLASSTRAVVSIVGIAV